MALDFPGASADFVTTGDASPASIEMTLSAWVYLDALPPNTLFYFYVAKGAGQEYEIGTNWLGNAIFNIKAGGVSYGASSGNGAVSASSWIHLLGYRVNQGGNNLFIEVDGTPGANPNNSGVVAITDTALNTLLGRWSANGSGTPFDGRLAEVAIWNRALTIAERVIIRSTTPRGPLNIDTTGLLAYWPLTENQGLIARDISGPFPGSLGGAVGWDASTPLVLPGLIETSGQKFLLQVKTNGQFTKLAEQTSLKLPRLIIEAETTSKDSASWREGLQVMRRWATEVEGMYIEDDAPILTLESAYNNLSLVDIRVITPSFVVYDGTATVTDFNTVGPHDDIMRATARLTGSGILTKVPLI